MFLLVGFGYTGTTYSNSRHNVGFFIIDEIVNKFELKKIGIKNESLLFKGNVGNKAILAIKPTTMMNNSGLAVNKIKKFYKIPINKIFVFYDEIDLIFLKIRIKTGGSSAGHNGIKSINNLIGNKYNRVRIGIGKPMDSSTVSKFVLSNFYNSELKALKDKLDLISCNLEVLLEYKFSIFLNNILEKKA